MDTVTGQLILSEMKVELGVYEGDLPVMRFGIVQLPGNPPASDPTSSHRFLLRGIDYNDSTAFICDCGEAFLELSKAYDHFFTCFKSMEPELFVNEDATISVQTSELSSTNEYGSDLTESETKTDYSSNQIEHTQTDEGTDNDIKSTNECSQNQIKQKDSDEEGVNDMEVEVEKSDVEISSESETANPKEKNNSSRIKKCRKSPLKITKLRRTTEAIFVQYGYPSEFKYTVICAAVLDIHTTTLLTYVTESRKMKAEDNPFRKNLTQKEMEKARKVNDEVLSFITNKRLPNKLKQRTEAEMTVAQIRSKHGSLNRNYRRILANHLTIGMEKLSEFYKFAEEFKSFEQDPIPFEIKIKAENLDTLVSSELQEKNPTKSKQKLIKCVPNFDEQRLVMEALWEKYGLDYGLEFRNKCAGYLDLAPKTLKQWYTKANNHSKTLKKSYYNNLFTDAVRMKAEKLHADVLKDMGGKPGNAIRGPTQRKVNQQLVMEGIFQIQGTNLTVPYRNQCADQLRIPETTVRDYYKVAKKRQQLRLENPLAHLINEEILQQSRDLHEKVTAKLENEKQKRD